MTIMAMALIGLMARAQQPTAPAVEKINERCPVNVSDGCTLTSVSVGDKAVTFVYQVADGMFGNLEPMKDILHDTMVAEFMSSPDPAMKQVVAFCVASDFSILQKFMSEQGASFDIVISPAEMK